MRCRVLDCDDYRITQYYSSSHKAIDMVKYYSNTCPIIAHSNGVVVFCQTGQVNNPNATGNASYGNCIKLRHDDGYYTLYAHMEKVYVKKGDYVKQGQQIGYMGNTGRSFGAHLHFEVREPNENRINPEPYLHKDLPNMSGYQTYDNVKNKWLPLVQFSQNDYAGNIGNGVSALRIYEDIEYMVHDKVKGYWLPIVRGASDYAGNLPNDIDGVAIKSDNYKYRVHLLRENRWLPYVDGFDVNDWRNGYAGNLGQVIDAIEIKNK